MYIIGTKGISKWNKIRIDLNSQYQKLKFIFGKQSVLTKDKIIEIENHTNYDFDERIENYDMFYHKAEIVDNFREIEAYQKIIKRYRKLFYKQYLFIIAFFCLTWIIYRLIIFFLGQEFQLY
ncbi:MAG: hypothetical protein ACI85O_001709 [Saprospiraceae bacterium]|jgi:hypothetical protein